MLLGVDPAEIAVALVAGAGGGTLAALVTPYAQWGVDKRRQRRERRTAIVNGARELVHGGQGMDRSEILIDPRYLAIRPHLTEGAEQALRAQHVTAVSDTYGTVGNPYLALIRNEADRLAKEWKL
jgi:hypothetical protein